MRTAISHEKVIMGGRKGSSSSSSGQKKAPPKVKAICRNMKKDGVCRHGATCWFRHDIGDVSAAATTSSLSGIDPADPIEVPQSDNKDVVSPPSNVIDAGAPESIVSGLSVVPASSSSSRLSSSEVRDDDSRNLEKLLDRRLIRLEGKKPSYLPDKDSHCIHLGVDRTSTTDVSCVASMPVGSDKSTQTRPPRLCTQTFSTTASYTIHDTDSVIDLREVLREKHDEVDDVRQRLGLDAVNSLQTFSNLFSTMLGIITTVIPRDLPSENEKSPASSEEEEGEEAGREDGSGGVGVVAFGPERSSGFAGVDVDASSIRVNKLVSIDEGAEVVQHSFWGDVRDADTFVVSCNDDLFPPLKVVDPRISSSSSSKSRGCQAARTKSVAGRAAAGSSSKTPAISRPALNAAALALLEPNFSSDGTPVPAVSRQRDDDATSVDTTNTGFTAGTIDAAAKTHLSRHAQDRQQEWGLPERDIHHTIARGKKTVARDGKKRYDSERAAVILAPTSGTIVTTMPPANARQLESGKARALSLGGSHQRVFTRIEDGLSVQFKKFLGIYRKVVLIESSVTEVDADMLLLYIIQLCKTWRRTRRFLQDANHISLFHFHMLCIHHPVRCRCHHLKTRPTVLHRRRRIPVLLPRLHHRRAPVLLPRVHHRRAPALLPRHRRRAPVLLPRVVPVPRTVRR